MILPYYLQLSLSPALRETEAEGSSGPPATAAAKYQEGQTRFPWMNFNSLKNVFTFS